MIDAIGRSLDGQSVAQAVRTLTELFSQNRIDTPALDARLLTGAACRLDDVKLITLADQRLTSAQARDLGRFVAARLARVPVSRIINHREFYGLAFRLSKHTLDPRPDSETLVTAALGKARTIPRLSVLDLGTGSGCLLLALLSQVPDAVGLGVDISAGAVRTARLNAGLNGLRERAHFRQSNWFSQVSGRFDMIVANPPYIRPADLAGLAPEVKGHDPVKALVADQDGLGDFARIAGAAAPFLKQDGWLGFEVGQGQAGSVAGLLTASGFRQLEVSKDLAGIDRVVMAQKG
ncbi:MAG: peptide chain release factor N(5)-glutamine methyltransferase [Parvibaculales bacterium]